MPVVRVISAVLGIILALVAIGVVCGGAGLLVAGSLRSEDGFIKSPAFAVTTTRYALVATTIEVAPHPGDWLPPGLATIKVELTPQGSKPLFVGIGPAADVDRYLAGVGRDVFDRTATDGGHPRPVDGGAPGSPPDKLTFWTKSVEGPGPLTLSWELAAGSWAVAILNADASGGVSATARVGANVPLLFPIGLILLIAGLVVGTVAVFLLVAATAGAHRESTMVRGPVGRHPAAPYAGSYPLMIEGRVDNNLSRWLWLVKWLLAIPHLIVLSFLWLAFGVLTVIAFFAILFTGRYPRGIFDFNVGVLRWTWRVLFYAFSPTATDRYPPFTLADADYPARLDVQYPVGLSRGLALVKWWLLAIPHYIVVGLFTNGLVWWAVDPGTGNTVLRAGGGLIGILTLVALIALLVTGRYLSGVFDLVMGLNRWVFRVIAYAALMRDEYPPFRLDLGGHEPPPPVPATGEQPLARPAAA